MTKTAAPSVPTIDVFALAKAGGRIRGCIANARFARLAPLLASTDGEMAWEMRGEIDQRGRPAASLALRGAVIVRCDRCGRNFDHPIQSESHYWFVETEEALNALPIDVSETEPLLGSREFSVTQLVEDELILAIPISPRHAHCAIAEKPADESDRNRPLAALATLRSRH
ncbi:MAG: YceD family protein [Gemmatimonadota bacterium]